jgi:hypothetical protein
VEESAGPPDRVIVEANFIVDVALIRKTVWETRKVMVSASFRRCLTFDMSLRSGQSRRFLLKSVQDVQDALKSHGIDGSICIAVKVVADFEGLA